MKLQRIALDQLRRFRDGLVIDGLEPGLNLFSGPNEAGKSSIVRALRAAFFERHRSSAVDDLRPWGDSAAAPRVELDFEHGGTQYRLRKSFLLRKRCDLEIRPAHGAVRTLDGDEAEQHLADLLGFRHAAKGASRPELWGIPGLLWIEQGRVQDLHEPLDHAHEPLRRVLEAALGPVASSDGDAVMRRVRAARDELLTTTGRPRGDFTEARAQLEQQTAALAELDARIAQYREQVDRLGRLAAEAARDEAAAPWLGLRAQAAQARQQLAEAQALARQLDADRERLVQTEGTRDLLRTQQDQARRREAELQRRRAGAQTAQERLGAAREHEQRLRAQQAAATAAVTQAGTRLAAARRADAHADLARQRATAAADAERLQATLAQAEAAAAQQARWQAALAAQPLAPAVLERWRSLEAQRQQQDAQAAAVATRLEFHLTDAAGLSLDDRALPLQGELQLTAPARLALPGHGEIVIVPGGGDLAELRRAQAALDEAVAALRASSGLADRAEAEQRQQARQSLQAQLQAVQSTLAGLAPQGLDALRSARAEQQARHAALDARAQALAAADAPADESADESADDPALPLAEAERAHAAALDAERAAAQSLAEARTALATAEAQHEAAARELAALDAELADPARQAEQAELARRQRSLDAEIDAARAALAAAQARWQAARPELLAQDIERWERSADQAERTARERQTQLTLLRGKLEEAGAHGLEEERAGREAERAALALRTRQLAQRAAALELLLHLLGEERLQLTRQLHAPLQRHLQHGLDLLWPGASIELGEDLSPRQISRPGAHGLDTAAFDELSYGAREQLGLVARIAYADLLREAGRPTLLILDDALVHSDEDRLGRMKRVLYDAARRHQVLLFTCHPEAWRDLGAPLRPLDALGRAAA